MTRTLRHRLRSEHGFSLIELLVVVLIIGILAAIAIPVLVSQRGKSQDADAKSNVRTAYAALEACSIEDRGTYTDCANSTALDKTNLRYPADGEDPGPGEVSITAAGGATFTIKAASASGRVFWVSKAEGTGARRTIDSVSGAGW